MPACGKAPSSCGVYPNCHANFLLDPSGKHIRLEVNSILKDKSGALISYKYSGIINITPGVAAVLGGNPDAKTTEFGDACKCLNCHLLAKY
jgi:hypothetical protein